MIKMDSASDVY